MVPLLRAHENITYFKYEELRQHTAESVAKVLSFLGASHIDKSALEWAVEQCKFDNLQKREWERKGVRVTKEMDANLLRVRKGVAGGYHDEMSSDDIHYVSAAIAEHSDPLFGY